MPVSSYCNESEHRACSNTVSCAESGWVACECLCHNRQKALIANILPHLNEIETEIHVMDRGLNDKHISAGAILSELDNIRRAMSFPNINTDYELPDYMKEKEAD